MWELKRVWYGRVQNAHPFDCICSSLEVSQDHAAVFYKGRKSQESGVFTPSVSSLEREQIFLVQS
ncbi:hypothetical protein CJ030_MR6G006808 [Morella rubra]|uniref:Uncharacterized protein n=1 Tax=Morella rubra TaxID=262757 RepID=A0A6A1VC83_9ROSI|nr:hypothetical protein CJ030_MR6G006808 [Morella rubra]